MKEWTAFKIEKCAQAFYARVNTLLQTSQQNPQPGAVFFRAQPKTWKHRLSVTHLRRLVLDKSIQFICVWAHSHLYFLFQIAWGQLTYNLQNTRWCFNQILARSSKQLGSHKWDTRYSSTEISVLEYQQNSINKIAMFSFIFSCSSHAVLC